MALETARDGHSEDRRLDQLACDKARLTRLTEADGKINAFRHQVAEPNPQADDQALQDRLIAICQEVSGVALPA